MMPEASDRYGFPLGVIHRGDLQRILLQAAEASGCRILTSHNVVRVDAAFEARVQVSSGEWFSGDVVFAADGVRSAIRAQLAACHGLADDSVPTGDAAYRLLIPRERMEQDERALALLDENVGMRWMGPGGHIMAYPLNNNSLYNMVLLHPAKKDQQSRLDIHMPWTTKGNRDEMMDFYRNWSPLVRSLLSYVPEDEVLEWTLNSHRPLPHWVKGKLALVGDSCHPMLPYVAQGAANAIEDAGAIAAVFTRTDNVSLGLKVYELARKERGEKIQASASHVRHALHLPDGPEQQDRDRAIRAAGQGQGRNPDLWADVQWRDYMWGVDVMKEIMESWDGLVQQAEARCDGRQVLGNTQSRL